MAKPKSTAGGGEIIENRFFLTLRKVFYLEYLFLLTVLVRFLYGFENVDAGYLTKGYDVSQDVIVNIEDCGTLRC
jgi:DNA-directed RNA polymerase subunit beta'